MRGKHQDKIPALVDDLIELSCASEAPDSMVSGCFFCAVSYVITFGVRVMAARIILHQQKALRKRFTGELMV